MLPTFRLPSSHADNVYERLPNAHPERALTDAECRSLMDQVRQQTRDAATIRSFLQSNDPAARMDNELRETLLNQCNSIADTRYLKDVWPDASTRHTAASDATQLPALRMGHQTETQTKAQQLKTLSELVISMADKKLEVFLGPLQQNVLEVSDLLNQLMGGDSRAYHMAQALIDCIKKRNSAGTLEGCWIGRYEQDLRLKADMLETTKKAITTLIQLRTGNGDNVSFSMAHHPTFHAEWKRALSDMEQMRWESFEWRVDALRRWREGLLPDALPVVPFTVSTQA